MRPDRLHHLAHEHVAQLRLAGLTVQPEFLRRGHITADRLAVQSHQPLDRPQSFAGQPEAQHLTHLEHGHLPIRHRCPPGHRRRERGECTLNGAGAGGPPGGPITGEPMVPLLANRWSHPPGETQLKVVPCPWRATDTGSTAPSGATTPTSSTVSTADPGMCARLAGQGNDAYAAGDNAAAEAIGAGTTRPVAEPALCAVDRGRRLGAPPPRDPNVTHPAVRSGQKRSRL